MNRSAALPVERSAGFTLIELVVALALLAMMATLIVEALEFSNRSWRKVEAITSESEVVGTVQHALRLHLQQMMAIQPEDIAPSQCSGTSDWVAFVAPAPDSDVGGGTASYRLSIESTAGGKQLVMAWRPFSQTGSMQADLSESKEILLTRLADASLSYFVVTGGTSGWSTVWSGCSTPPKPVRLNVSFEPASTSDWPDLVVRPRLDVAADCKFDFVAIRCSRL